MPSASPQPYQAIPGRPDPGTSRNPGTPGGPGPRYKWVALSSTTLGMLMAAINSSIMLIALPVSR